MGLLGRDFEFGKIKPSFYGEVPKKLVEKPKILGIDTETYVTGEPFLICVSDGFVSDDPFTILDQLVERYAGYNLFAYNLKFDMGSLLYHVSRVRLQELREYGMTEWHGLKIKVIGNKLLAIKKGKRPYVRIWDAMSFFGNTSLEHASQVLLGKGKVKGLDVENFTTEYVEEHWDEIVRYCLQDAKLVEELMDSLVEEFYQFAGFYPRTYYSPASWSAEYFSEEAQGYRKFMRKVWHEDPDLIRFFCEAYRGGKFLVLARGYTPKAYEYDIHSAYPSVIAELKDLEGARWVYHKGKPEAWHLKADYGALCCVIETYDDAHPVALKNERGVSYYPVGSFEATITLEEYKYLLRLGAKVAVQEGYYIYCKTKRRPFRDKVKRLYELKQREEKETFRYHLIKILLNGFYGKTAQLIPVSSPKGDYIKAGPFWCPIYAAYITAIPRIWLCELERQYRGKVLALHTDSILSVEPIPLNIGDELGQWELSREGEALVIMSGIYQVGRKVAQRGIKKLPQDLIETVRNLKPDATGFHVWVRRPRSWREAVDTGRDINEFFWERRLISFNMDSKRVWERKATAQSLLEGLEWSIPYMVCRDFVTL